MLVIEQCVPVIACRIEWKFTAINFFVFSFIVDDYNEGYARMLVLN